MHDARLVTKLPAHLLHDRRRGAPDRGHAERAEQIGKQPAEQEASHHVRIVQREIELDASKVWMVRCVGDEEFEILIIGREQNQRAKTSRADRIALGHRLGGIADCVERVRRFAHLFRQPGHLCDTAGIIGNRAKGVERHDHAGEREHGGHGDGDPEESGEFVADQNAGDDDDCGKRRGFERNSQTLDDVGAMTSDRCLGDRLHRPEVGAGVVFGDPNNQASDGKTNHSADE